MPLRTRVPIVATIMFLASCSSSAASPSSTVSSNSAYSADQVQELQDGRISEAEYHRGFRRFATCLEASGFHLANVVDRGVRIDYVVPAEADDAGVYEPCYTREFAGVDEEWQVNSPDPQKTAIYSACLQRRGMSVPAAQADMVKVLLTHHIDPMTCQDVP